MVTLVLLDPRSEPEIQRRRAYGYAIAFCASGFALEAVAMSSSASQPAGTYQVLFLLLICNLTGLFALHLLHEARQNRPQGRDTSLEDYPARS